MKISEVGITPIKPQNGLVGFASMVIDGNIYLGSIAVYVKPDGSYRLLYPAKKTGNKQMDIFHPINYFASKEIEKAIFDKCKKVFEGSNENDRYNKNGSYIK